MSTQFNTLHGKCARGWGWQQGEVKVRQAPDHGICILVLQLARGRTGFTERAADQSFLCW